MGMINHYRDMVSNKTKQDIIMPASPRLASTKIPLTWIPTDTTALRDIQKAFAEEVLLSFPDFNKLSRVYAERK